MKPRLHPCKVCGKNIRQKKGAGRLKECHRDCLPLFMRAYQREYRRAYRARIALDRWNSRRVTSLP